MEAWSSQNSSYEFLEVTDRERYTDNTQRDKMRDIDTYTMQTTRYADSRSTSNGIVTVIKCTMLSCDGQMITLGLKMIL